MANDSLFKRALRKFGYEPIRDTSQATPELAEEAAFEGETKTEDFLKAYLNSLWVYICVNKVATSAAKVPFKFYKKRISKGGKRVDLPQDHELYQLLRKVNPWCTRFNLMDATFAFVLLAGNAYWELCRKNKKSNKIKEIYVLRPDRIEVIPDPKKYIKGYTYTINGKEIPFKAEDILQFKLFSPILEYEGTPATKPAERLISLDLYAWKYNVRFFKAGARVLGVLETDRSLSDKAIKRLETKWIGKYGGYEKAFKTAILEEGLKYKPTATTHKEMEFIELAKMVRESICSAYGVYPAIVGLFEYSNYSNATEQRQLFYEETIIPLLIWMQEYISSFLCPYFDSRIVGEFDQSAIGALKEKEEIKAKKSAMLVRNKIFNPEEIREMFYGISSKPKGSLGKKDLEKLLSMIRRINMDPAARKEFATIIRNLDEVKK